MVIETLFNNKIQIILFWNELKFYVKFIYIYILKEIYE